MAKTTLIRANSLDKALDALQELIKREERKGKHSLVFCEDKLTLICERKILSKIKGSFLTEVTTFSRFLSGRGVLSKQGSVMLISSIIEENSDQLSCFHERAASAVYETIAQLNASKVDEDLLLMACEKSDGLLKNKLRDLSFIFFKYREKLKEGEFLDESEYLSLLPEKIESANLQNTSVFFFGFPSFTRQAQDGIRAAIQTAISVTGIFLGGDEAYFTNESGDVFLKICQELGEEPQCYSLSEKRCEEAEILSSCLFSGERPSESFKTEKVKRFAPFSEREELETVCALIKKGVFEGKRFSDFAVLIGGEESFLNAENCFSSYRIPFYADKKREYSDHPFCRFVLAILNAVHDGALPNEVDEVLGSYYFGEDGSEYRNYLLKYGGYRGACRREIKDGDAARDFDTKALSSCRERLLKILALFPRRGKGSDYVNSIKKLFEEISAEEKTEELKEYFLGAEREFLSLKPLVGVLNEMEYLAGEKIFTAREFHDALQNGLSALKISMIPQSLDAVFIGDVTQSRFERVKTLFAISLTGDVPCTSFDTALISDGEMDRLDEIKVCIEPKIERVNARARESLALNLCSFEEELYLSCPLQKAGEEVEKSEIFADAEKIFSMQPMPDLFPFDCSEEAPALMQLFQKCDTREQMRRRDSLFELFKEEYGERFLERLRSDGKKKNIKSETEERGASPTVIEKYFDCPYKSFASRLLRLKEREERAVLDTDTGDFIHAVLKTCSDKFEEFSSSEELLRFAQSVSEQLMDTPRYLPLKDTPQGEYVFLRLISEAKEVCLAAFEQVKGSRFHVQRSEEGILLQELSLRCKPDRIDRSKDYIRIIDYKTGKIDDKPIAYYTGRKMQLQLYLKAASQNGAKTAGAFYFPASGGFKKEGEEKYRLKGFFCSDEEVLSDMDLNMPEVEMSRFFEGKRGGRRTEKGMTREDFDAFCDYSILLASKAEREMKEGVISPRPYQGSCETCKYCSMCGFVGEKRNEGEIGCKEIARIVKRERGEL